MQEEGKFPNNKFFRRLALVWALCLITFAVVKTFVAPPNIPGGTVTALTAVIGLLATVIGFYQWSRKRDEERREKEKGLDGTAT